MRASDEMFTRSFQIESHERNLTLYQEKIGEVNCVVWDAALVLAKYLDVRCQNERSGRDWLSGKKVIELGSGVGCVGMTAACLGADVVCTDLASALPILEKNIQENEQQWKSSQGSVSVRVLEWGKDISEDLSPDLVLLADCVYYTESIDPLLETLEILCNRKAEAFAILSQEERDTPGQIRVWEIFMEKLRGKFNVEIIPVSEQDSTYSSDDIHLMKLTTKKK